MAFSVAYLVNQYPKVSHSFIRREILALERRGLRVQRIAIRGWDADVADPADEVERSLTRYVLQQGIAVLVTSMLLAVGTRPVRFAATLALSLRMARGSDRPLGIHLAYVAEACVALRWVLASGAMHVHAHFGTNAAEVAMLIHSLGGPPYSFTVHGPEEFDRPGALGLSEKMRRAAFVVAVSSFGRSQLFRWAALADWPKIEVVHCGLDSEFHADAPTLPPAEPRLVCVGRLCEQKGQLLLIEAVHSLLRKGSAMQLVLAGDGELRAEVEALIARLDLGAAVTVTGWIGSAQVREQLLAARALVLPSFAEGLPVVLMEAMALRRPVVATYVAGIPELVRPGKDGWLIPAGDVSALVDALQACLMMPVDDLARMGESARQRVLARHDADTEAAKLAALFEKAAALHGS